MCGLIYLRRCLTAHALSAIYLTGLIAGCNGGSSGTPDSGEMLSPDDSVMIAAPIPQDPVITNPIAETPTVDTTTVEPPPIETPPIEPPPLEPPPIEPPPMEVPQIATSDPLLDLDQVDPALLPLTLEPLPPIVSGTDAIETGNRPPYFENLTDQIIYAGAEMNLVIRPRDPDGGVAGVYIESLPGDSVFLDNRDSTRTLRWRPLQPAVGIHTITVIAGDSVVPTYRTSQTIRLQVIMPDDPSTIVNLPPILNQIDEQLVRAGDKIVARVRAVDLNGTFGPIELLNPPAGATFQPDPVLQDTYVLQWPTTQADAGIRELQFRAYDALDSALSDSKSIVFRIADSSEFIVPGSRLRNLADARGFLLGYASALDYSYRADADLYAAMAQQEFNLLTTENSLKWGYVNPEPNQWRWEGADAEIALARSANMTVHGHPLVWHWQLPRWVQRLSVDKRKDAMLGFIQTVVSRYNNDINIWDVVNEGLNADGSFRQSMWYDAMGEAYIDLAFTKARQHAPSAQLLYNDFDVAWINPKSDAMYALVQRLLNAGVPVDGVGFQMHIDADFNKFGSVKSNFQRFADLGLAIYVTELDVGMANGQSLEQQAAVFQNVLTLCLEQPQCKALQTWGFTDRYSWREDETPLLFDRNYKPKPAYFALQQGL